MPRDLQGLVITNIFKKKTLQIQSWKNGSNQIKVIRNHPNFGKIKGLNIKFSVNKNSVFNKYKTDVK